MTGVSFPTFPYRHVRPSLLFEVDRWAVVCEDMTDYLNLLCMGWCDNCLEYDLCREARGFQRNALLGMLPGFHFTLLKGPMLRLGSTLEILGVFDGTEPDGYPEKSPTTDTGMIWARHFPTRDGSQQSTPGP